MPEDYKLFQKFVEELTNLLERKDFSNAVSFFGDEKYKEYLKNKSWDLIPIFCKNITREAKLRNIELANCSEKLLEILAIEANPEEAILEFLDQMDGADTEKFVAILKLLKIILLRDTSNKLKSLEWILNSIRSYTEQYSYSENVNDFELQNDIVNVVSDEKLLQIKSVLTSIITFYSDIVKKVNQDLHTDDKRVLLSSRLIQIFDIFLPYVNIDLVPQLKVFRLKIIELILQLISNPMTLLKYVFFRSVNSTKSNLNFKDQSALKKIYSNEILDGNSIPVNVNENLNPFEDETVVSDLAFGMFFYSLLCENENDEVKLPMVYNPKYIILSLIYVTVPLFDNKPNITVMNGLKFLYLLLNRLNDFFTISDLYFCYHKTILMSLNNIMVFSQVEGNRKLAVKCFNKYIESFNWEGRYLLLLNLRPHVNHSGSLGFLIGLFKQFVSNFLELPISSLCHCKYAKYYRGKLLFDIIKTYCFLKNISDTDLVENADHILSSLNVLRYLVLKDRQNIINISHFIDQVYSQFLNPLRKNISTSKNYYDMKLKEIETTENSRNISNSQSNIDVNLVVVGQDLPELNKEEQKVAYYSCINVVDLINSLLIRLIECIEEIYHQFL